MDPAILKVKREKHEKAEEQQQRLMEDIVEVSRLAAWGAADMEEHVVEDVSNLGAWLAPGPDAATLQAVCFKLQDFIYDYSSTYGLFNTAGIRPLATLDGVRAFLLAFRALVPRGPCPRATGPFHRAAPSYFRKVLDTQTCFDQFVEPQPQYGAIMANGVFVGREYRNL
jgi:hypothetical protein